MRLGGLWGVLLAADTSWTRWLVRTGVLRARGVNVEKDSVVEDTEWKRDPLGCSGVLGVEAPLWHWGDTTGGLGVTGLGNCGAGVAGPCMWFAFRKGVDGYMGPWMVDTNEVLTKGRVVDTEEVPLNLPWEDTSGADGLMRLAGEMLSRGAAGLFCGLETIWGMLSSSSRSTAQSSKSSWGGRSLCGTLKDAGGGGFIGLEEGCSRDDTDALREETEAELDWQQGMKRSGRALIVPHAGVRRVRTEPDSDAFSPGPDDKLTELCCTCNDSDDDATTGAVEDTCSDGHVQSASSKSYKWEIMDYNQAKMCVCVCVLQFVNTEI